MHLAALVRHTIDMSSATHHQSPWEVVLNPHSTSSERSAPCGRAGSVPSGNGAAPSIPSLDKLLPDKSH